MVAMFAFEEIVGRRAPVLDVNSVVTPGPWPEIMQSVWEMMPMDVAPFL
jgi:hypothetical protein